MFKNYIKIAWRNIKKYKLYSAINIFGLFAGILFFFLIGAYVWTELQVNRNLKNVKNQYILTSQWKMPDMGYDLATLGPLSKRLKEDYPQLVKNYYRYDGISVVVAKGDKRLKENVQLGDSTLLRMYGFKTLYGDALTALNEPFSTVLTKSIALKYFNAINVVGETIAYRSFGGEVHDFTIKAVVDDFLENSVTMLTPDYPSSIFVPTVNYNYFGRNNLDDWRNVQIASYIELQDGVKPEDLEKPILQLLKQNTAEPVQANLRVQPVSLLKYHFSRSNGTVQRIVYTLSLVAIFILIMAIINFINVSISSASTRMREIGVRKVIGGSKQQLLFQFLSESLILVALAVLLAVAAYPVMKNVFSSMVGKNLPTLTSFPLYIVFVPILLVLLIGLLAGLYPALRLTSVNMVSAVKGTLKTVGENIFIRKSLIAFQFSIALIVMIASYIITQQVNYFFGNKLGYDKEYIVTAQVPRDWTKPGVDKMIAIRDQFAKMPEISSVSLSYEIPNGNNGGSVPVFQSGQDSNQSLMFQLLSTDEKYLDTYRVPLKNGRFFDGYRRDSAQVILNETGAKALGYKNTEEVIGKQLHIPGDATAFTVKGVIKDFHFASMSDKIAPTLLFNLNFNPTYRFLNFKLKPGNIPQSLDALQKMWNTLIPEASFEYTFMSDSLRRLYAKELQLKKAGYAATILTMIIVLLGVFSMVSLSIRQRIKEIGIRKVLGATSGSLVRLFSREFIIILLLAATIAAPVGYWLMKTWLQNYTYQIPLSAWPFIASFGCISLILLLLIGTQTIKAAMANPVKTLRAE